LHSDHPVHSELDVLPVRVACSVGTDMRVDATGQVFDCVPLWRVVADEIGAGSVAQGLDVPTMIAAAEECASRSSRRACDEDGRKSGGDDRRGDDGEPRASCHGHQSSTGRHVRPDPLQALLMGGDALRAAELI
jgi:hypothetical protein